MKIVHEQVYDGWYSAKTAAKRLGRELKGKDPGQSLHEKYDILRDGGIKLTIKQSEIHSVK